MTPSRRQGYGSRPPVRDRLLLLLALAAAACTESQYTRPPPTDAFTWPLGVAVHRLPGGGTTLLVGSTNTDLLYDAQTGGTVMAIDPDAWLQQGVVNVPSFGGPIAVADDDTCPGLSAAGIPPRAILGSRYADEVAILDIGTAGQLTCDGCIRTLPLGSVNPFATAVACVGTRRQAYVGYLASNIVVAVDLATSQVAGRFGLLTRPYALAYEAGHDRLWVTEQQVFEAPLEALDLGPGCTPSQGYCDIRRTYDLYPILPGLELAGLAFGHGLAGEATRLYVAGRVYDPTVAATLGYRPGYDISSVLLVIDLVDGPLGYPPAPVVRRIVPVAIGASQVAVLSARPGLRDVVVVTSTNEGVVTLYDDEVGAVAKVFALAETVGPPENPARVPLGTPLVGRQPWGIAVEPRAAPGGGTVDWVYVSAFESGAVTAIAVDPAAPAGAAIQWMRVGANP